MAVDVENLPELHDITIQQGTSYRKLHTLQRETDTATAAVSLASVTWSLKVYDAPSGGTAKLTKSTTSSFAASGIYVDSAADGKYTVHLLAADVEALAPGTYYYEVTAVFPAGSTDFATLTLPLLKGMLTVLPDLA
jgi:hypothetical protein